MPSSTKCLVMWPRSGEVQSKNSSIELQSVVGVVADRWRPSACLEHPGKKKLMRNSILLFKEVDSSRKFQFY